MSGCELKEKPLVFELEKTGLWGEAVRRRGPVITNDYSAPNPLKRDCPAGHIKILRHMNLPVISDGRIVAVAGVGNKPSDYDENDVRHLNIFMDATWNILERMRAEEELQVAKEMAEASDRFKSNVMSNLSHELRTPLNGIMGGAQLLATTELTPDQQGYLEMIEISSTNELTLVNNLLELARMDSDKIATEKSVFSLVHCLDGILRTQEPAIRAKGIELYRVIETEVPSGVEGDPVKLGMMLQCLMGNALKFTECGSITVRLSSDTDDQSGRQIARITITDTGTGIEKEKLEVVFEPFIQSDMTNTRQYGGLGIGLAICRRIAKEMGGAISVESTPGKGSTFVIELPIVPIDVVVETETLSLPLEILLAEDDYYNSLVMAGLLKKLGHRVITAPNGQDAVNIFRKRPFDLVLMDIQMPVMSGVDALNQIREIEKETARPPVPVIAVTAFGRQNIGGVLSSSDFSCVLPKPIKLTELQDAIERFCKANGRIKTAQNQPP